MELHWTVGKSFYNPVLSLAQIAVVKCKYRMLKDLILLETRDNQFFWLDLLAIRPGKLIKEFKLHFHFTLGLVNANCRIVLFSIILYMNIWFLGFEKKIILILIKVPIQSQSRYGYAEWWVSLLLERSEVFVDKTIGSLLSSRSYKLYYSDHTYISFEFSVGTSVLD